MYEPSYYKHGELQLLFGFLFQLFEYFCISYMAIQLPTDRRRVRTPPVVSICGVCTRIYICSV
jgi:hypothetical protein